VKGEKNVLANSRNLIPQEIAQMLIKFNYLIKWPIAFVDSTRNTRFWSIPKIYIFRNAQKADL